MTYEKNALNSIIPVAEDREPGSSYSPSGDPFG